MEALCDIDALIAAHNAAYDAHDVAAFIRTLDVDAEIYEHPGQRQLKGHDEIRAHYTQLFAKLPELTVTMTRHTPRDKHILYEERLRTNGQ